MKEVVLVIQSVESDETLERWSFTIEGDEGMKTAQKGEEVEVDLKEIQKGIKDVVRQIVATSKSSASNRGPEQLSLKTFWI